MAALTVDLRQPAPLADKHFLRYCRTQPARSDRKLAGAAATWMRCLRKWKQVMPRKRAVRLKTEGAFHTYYMVEAGAVSVKRWIRCSWLRLRSRCSQTTQADITKATRQTSKSRLFFNCFTGQLDRLPRPHLTTI